MTSPFSLDEVSVALSPLERFEEFLQSRSMRITKPRRIIVEEVFSRHEHFDVEELLARLKTSNKHVSRPTVYRTLSDLVDAGLLRKMELSGRAVYEHDYGYPQHDHLYCTRCERLIEFHSDQLKESHEAVASEHKFRVTGHRLIIYGICKNCSRTRRRDQRLDLV